ncbi:hypothetical protein ALC53_06411 [Atta colombica]|uniref:Uncharacterized protein n=1 Tax=Atta colombica TaxID=520822 RepID=A0A195BG12_9HYME|nr:hypothetical protein ALC53_06411 [Atta colombica]
MMIINALVDLKEKRDPIPFNAKGHFPYTWLNLDDIARLYTERVLDVINTERAIMHVRRADLFPLSKPWDFEKRESFDRVRELLVVIAFADTLFLEVIAQ